MVTNPLAGRENRLVALSGIYFFFVAASCYVLRPIRDELAIANGLDRLPWMFTATLVATLAANWVYSACLTYFPVRSVISWMYRTFAVLAVVFFFLFSNADGPSVRFGLFLWISVFNLLAVSVFWSVISDAFGFLEGARSFGRVAAGGTLGAIAGAGLTSLLVERLGVAPMLLVAAVLIECATRCAANVPPPVREAHEPADGPLGGRVAAGAVQLWRSPFLLAVGGYTLLYTVSATFLYFEQAAIIGARVTDSVARTALLARMDTAVNLLALFGQVFLTHRLFLVFGTGLLLSALPLACVVGFSAIGFYPSLGVLIVFQVFRRAGHLAISAPMREALFTSVDREDRYKAKSFIDTFVYRGGDQLGAWSSALLVWTGAGVSGTALAAVPVAAAWLLLGLWIGGRLPKAAVSRQRPVVSGSPGNAECGISNAE